MDQPSDRVEDNKLEEVIGTENVAELNEAFTQAQNATTGALPEGQAGGAAQVPVLHVASERAHRAATNAVNEFGCGIITLTFDARGAYQFRSGDINVTYAIGLLHRAILTLQNNAQASPFR